jgi:hypothetical protein
MKVIKSPRDGEAGSVAVIATEVVLMKYPSLAAALKFPVLTVCQDSPPATSPKDKFPEPSVFNA